MPQRLQSLYDSLLGLGTQRLIALGVGAMMMIGIVIGGAYFLNRPIYETLYVGLDRDDVNRMAIVLSDAGIPYDVDAEGTTFLVAAGRAAQARMILAEKNLPGSAESGYELFDNMGSLGLTSFMQEVTRLRALEGEIARSIQTVNGVKAARVHIVMPDQSGFRDRNRQPTASVLLRSNGSDLGAQADGIRQLVAAAVPGLAKANVTVLDASGKLLASGDDDAGQSIGAALDLQQRIETDIGRKIGDALRPSVGESNYRIAVRAMLDTDRRQEERTIFDPDSRVERSVRVMRTKDNSSSARNDENATVEQNIPTENNQDTAGQTESTEESERREETTNYEINSTRIATVSNGFRVQKLSIAVVLNRASLAAAPGVDDAGQEPTQEQIDQKIDQISQLVAAAAGLDQERGDVVDVTAISFLPQDETLTPLEAPFMERFGPYISTLIQGLIFAAVAFAAIFFLGRPLISAAGGNGAAPSTDLALAEPDYPTFEPDQFTEGASGFAPPAMPEPGAGFGDAYFDEDETGASGSDIQRQIRDRMAEAGDSPRDRLAAMLEIDPDRTVQILRRWLAEAA